MRNVLSSLLLLCSILGISVTTNAQGLGLPTSLSANSGSLNGGPDQYGRPAPDSRAWTDPALNHNKLLQESSDGTYKLIGNYKVIGSSFLFGPHHLGDMFSTEAKAYNIYLSYNTYSQEVEFFSTANPDVPLVREAGTLDSFTIHPDPALGIVSPLRFVYGGQLGSKDKSYYLEMYKGDRFSLYKRYKSDLDYVSSNLGQSELRQFNLQVEYFYVDKQGKGIKKIKPNAVSVIKEFKDVKDLSASIGNDDYTMNPESSFQKAFRLINE